MKQSHPAWFTRLASKLARLSTAHHKGEYVQSVTVADAAQILGLLCDECARKPPPDWDDPKIDYAPNQVLMDRMYLLGAKRKQEAKKART